LGNQANPDFDNDVMKSKYKDLFVVEHNYVLKIIETKTSNKIKVPIADFNLEHIKRFDR